MNEPPKKYPRPQTATAREVESLAALRRRTPIRGIPVEIDPEQTPVPMSIETISRMPITIPRTATQERAVEALQAIPTPEGKLDALATAIASHADALAYQRERSHKLEQHGEQLATLAAQHAEFDRRLGGVEDGMRQWIALVAQLQTTYADNVRPVLAGHAKLINGNEVRASELSTRLGAFEREVAQLRADLKALQSTTAEISTSHKLMLKSLEDSSKRQDKAERHTEEQLPILVERITDLETSEEVERQLTTRQKAARIGAVGGGGFAIGEIVRWVLSLFHH